MSFRPQPEPTRLCWIGQKLGAERYLTCNANPSGLAMDGFRGALTSEAVQIGMQGVVDRRPKCYEDYQYDKVVRLPGI